MPKLRDPQGHKREVSAVELDEDSLGTCDRCGHPWSAKDVVQGSSPSDNAAQPKLRPTTERHEDSRR